MPQPAPAPAPEEPDDDLIVYDSPGRIEPGEDIVEFRDASTVETLMLANNEVGTLQPVAEIARAVAPVPVVVDGAQTAGGLHIDFDALGVGVRPPRPMPTPTASFQPRISGTRAQTQSRSAAW